MLAICKSFFDDLDKKNVRYCHWKSNVRLLNALDGHTDLDILVHSQDKPKFNITLDKYRFLRMISPPEKTFAGLEDYLGFDYQSGKLIHLHIHYQLVLGQRFVKNHHIPIENSYLENIVKKYGINIPVPELELLVLILRANMKVSVTALVKHTIKTILGKNCTPFPEDIELEMKYLMSISNRERLFSLLRETHLPIQSDFLNYFIEKFKNNSLMFYNIIYIRIRIFAALRKFRREKGVLFLCKNLWLITRSLRIIKYIFPVKKKIVASGFSFSIVGADGSGKSTLTRDLSKWLSWKTTVNLYYFGIPKNRLIKILNFALRILKKLKISNLEMIMEAGFWIYVAKKRFELSKSAETSKQKGRIVISDRFPLKQFAIMKYPMDGPRLSNFDGKLSILKKIELKYYENLTAPDHIFILQVQLEELRRRKNDTDLLTHTAKASVINNISESASISTIDANRSYPEVCLLLKRKIWHLLTTTSALHDQKAEEPC